MADPILGVTNILGVEKKKNMERLINYIATTPRNTNYQIVREAIEALVLNNSYNWEALSTTEELPKTHGPGTGTEITK